MGISYIPGPEAILGPALAQMTQGLGRIMNPNWELQQAAKAAIVQNPQLLQQLTDIEAISPGTLGKLGLGPVGQTIAAAPQSPQSMTQQAVGKAMPAVLGEAGMGDYLARKSVGAGKGERAAEELARKFNELGIEALKDEKVAKYVGRAKVGATAGEMSKDEYIGTTFATVGRMLADGTEITLRKLNNGEYTTEELNAIYSSPLGNILNQQADAEYRKQVIALDRMKLNWQKEKEEKDSSLEEALTKLDWTKAYDLASKIRFTVDPKTVYKYLNGTDEKSGKPFSELAQKWSLEDQKNLSPEQRQMVQAYQGIRQLDDEAKANIRNRVGTEVGAIFTKVQELMGKKNVGGLTKDKKSEQIKAWVNLMNSKAQTLKGFGIAPFTVEYVPGKEPLWSSNTPERIVFKDNLGNEINPVEVESGTYIPAPDTSFRNPADSNTTSTDTTPAAATASIAGIAPEVDSAEIARQRSALFALPNAEALLGEAAAEFKGLKSVEEKQQFMTAYAKQMPAAYAELVKRGVFAVDTIARDTTSSRLGPTPPVIPQVGSDSTKPAGIEDSKTNSLIERARQRGTLKKVSPTDSLVTDWVERLEKEKNYRTREAMLDALANINPQVYRLVSSKFDVRNR